MTTYGLADFWTAQQQGLPYFEAHPNSDMGDPNTAHRLGWKLVAIRPNGLMIYARRWPAWNWWWVAR